MRNAPHSIGWSLLAVTVAVACWWFGSSVDNLTKFGLTGFSESLRQVLLIERVRVSLVEPGTVDTEPVDNLRDVTRDAARQLGGNTVEALFPEDVADAIAYVVTRDRRVAVSEILLRAAGQTR